MLVCLATVLIGFSPVQTTEDKETIASATKRCPEFYPDEPCVKEITKTEELVYHVVCGEKKEQK